MNRVRMSAMNACDVAIIPASHWEARGHSPFYSRVLMEEFQRMLLSWIGILSTAEGVKVVRLFHFYDAEGSRENYHNTFAGPVIRVEWDDILLPLWLAFANALHDSPARGIVMQIANVELPEIVLNVIERALATKDVMRLQLMNTRFGRGGIPFAAHVLNENPSLELLSLDDEQLSSHSDELGELLSSIQGHPTLSVVSLDGCNIGNDCDLLDLVLDSTKHLKCLSLRRNAIGPEGARRIASVLRENPPLEGISLEKNEMKDEGIAELMQGLKRNTNLRTMSVSGNDISERGMKTIVETVLDTSSLNAVKDCNHSCKIIHDGSPLAFANSLASRGAKFAVACKLSFALGTSDDSGLNARYLEDVPLEFLPNVLEIVQRALFTGGIGVSEMTSEPEGRRECTSLKNVFEVIRNCVAPLIGLVSYIPD